MSEATKQKVKIAIQSMKWKPNINVGNLARNVEVAKWNSINYITNA